MIEPILLDFLPKAPGIRFNQDNGANKIAYENELAEKYLQIGLYIGTIILFIYIISKLIKK
jgi:hypothetical protein